ncbi:MAG: flagellar biosynthesis protein FlhB [Lachnospiraceae bacterium]
MWEEEIRIPYQLQFFAKDGPGGEKTEAPTSKKLEDARKEGQVAKSKEINSSASLLALFILLKIWTGNIAESFLSVFHTVYAKFPEYIKPPNGDVSVDLFAQLISEMLKNIMLIILPFLLVGFLIAFVGDLIQVQWHPTTKPLQPKFNKMNPVNGVKRIFSLQSLVELLKSILKIAVVIIILYNEIKNQWHYLYLLYDIPLMSAIAWAGNLLINIGLKISIFFAVIAFADFLFQKWKFNEDMKMTKQEVKDEYKQVEGDPQIKSQIRRRMQEASQRRMMQNLPKADVVITNPTHYAVAIQYDKTIADAPIVVAKGADYLAQRIKDVAKEHDIQIVENKPLARSLYANVEIGEQVPPELYLAVAEVLAAVYRAQGRV